MIQNLTQAITIINEFPQRSAYTSSQDYGAAVEEWLGKYGNLSSELSAFIAQLNIFVSETNNSISEIESNVAITNQDVITTNENVNTVLGAVSDLPDGVINDLTITNVDAWSSEKISTQFLNHKDISANYTAIKNDYLNLDSSGGAFTISLPATHIINDIVIINTGSSAETNNITIDGNGSNITMQNETDTTFIVDKNGFELKFKSNGTDWEVL